MFEHILEPSAADQKLSQQLEGQPFIKWSLGSSLDRLLLAKIASELPPQSIVVEIGTYLGAAMAVMSTVNSQIEIHAYDLFESEINLTYYNRNRLWSRLMFLGPGQVRTLANVSKLLEPWPNIQLHQVTAEETPIFDQAIDVFIEDSTHCNPQLRRSLDTWLPRVKQGGLALIHDYRPWLPQGTHDKWPDVESEVDRLAADSGWNFFGQLSGGELEGKWRSYAVFQKL
jgi:hypothetical protein